MNNQENEITLSQLFGVVKKSFKRALLYILISVFIAAVVTVTIRALSSYKFYSITISFSEAKEDYISTLTYDKSYIVNGAISDRNDSLKIADDLIKDLSISAVVPSNVENTEAFNPSTFVISLKSNKSTKLTSNEYKNILEKIADGYINLFSVKSLSTLYSEYSIDESVEYMQSAMELTDKAQSIYYYLNSYISEYDGIGDFRNSVTGKSFQNIVDEVNTIVNNLNNVQINIVLNKAEKTADGLKKYLTLAKIDVDNEAAIYQEQYTACEKALTDLSNLISDSTTSSTTSGNIYNVDTTLYRTLSQQYIELAEKYKIYDNKATKIQQYINVIPTESTGAESSINTSLSSTCAKLNNLISEYRDTAKEYNSNRYLNSLAKTINSAHTYTESFMSAKLIIIILIAVAMVAYIVAFTQRFTELKKEGYFNQQ